MLFIVKRVRLVEVAHEAGVHTATASRALNPATRNEVSRRTIRRVEQAAQRLGYVPNVMARGLRTARCFRNRLRSKPTSRESRPSSRS